MHDSAKRIQPVDIPVESVRQTCSCTTVTTNRLHSLRNATILHIPSNPNALTISSTIVLYVVHLPPAVVSRSLESSCS